MLTEMVYVTVPDQNDGIIDFRRAVEVEIDGFRFVRKREKTDNHQMLASCPFCGGEAIRIRAAEMVSDHGFFYIGCRSLDCGAVTSYHVETWDEAVERWNRREAAK